MPFNVLLLPLLGGFWWVSHWHPTRFKASRLSGHKLIFWSATAGVVLLAVSSVAVEILSRNWPIVEREFKELFPFSYFGTASGAFLLGMFGWWPINRLSDRYEWGWSKRNQEVKAVTDSGNHLEYLLMRAMSEQFQVQVTTFSRKVYVGYVTRTVDPAEDARYMKIIPSMSGFRRMDDLGIEYRTDYTGVLRQLADDEYLGHLGRNDFEVVIPISEIRSVSRWDPIAWERFETERPPDNPPAAEGMA